MRPSTSLLRQDGCPHNSRFGRRAPAHLPRHFLLFIVAYRLQADMHGDLDRVRALARLAKAGVGTVGTTPQAPSDRAPCSSASGRVLHRVTTRDQCFVPGTGPPTAACLRWPAPSRAPAGTDPASSVYARRRHEGRSKKAAALRHLHPRLNQVWAGAALQLPGCAARNCRGLHQEPNPRGRGLDPDRLHDGGLSGGSMGRPALQRLLSEVQAGSVDVVVVYKVDRCRAP